MTQSFMFTMLPYHAHLVANLHNLHQLWWAYANGRAFSTGRNMCQWNVHTQWPKRSWLSKKADNRCTLASATTEVTLPPRLLVPNLHILPDETTDYPKVIDIRESLVSFSGAPALEQTAMILPVSNIDSSLICQSQRATATLRCVTQLDELARWIEIEQAAFGYQTPQEVVQAFIEDAYTRESHTQLWLLYDGEDAVGAALTHRSEYMQQVIVGLHQIAVSPQAQGKGYGHVLMSMLLAQIDTANVYALTLQAVSKARGLYEHYGFEALATFDSFELTTTDWYAMSELGEKFFTSVI